jgi:hypothetical protein
VYVAAARRSWCGIVLSPLHELELWPCAPRGQASRNRLSQGLVLPEEHSITSGLLGLS